MPCSEVVSLTFRLFELTLLETSLVESSQDLDFALIDSRLFKLNCRITDFCCISPMQVKKTLISEVKKSWTFSQKSCRNIENFCKKTINNKCPKMSCNSIFSNLIKSTNKNCNFRNTKYPRSSPTCTNSALKL